MMNNNSFKLICITLVITLGLSWLLYFRQENQADTVDINKFPKTIGTWVAKELPITKEEFAILETRNAFARKYTNSVDGSSVTMFIVYSQTNRKVAHPPEVCYTGSGIAVQAAPRNQFSVKYKNLPIIANVLRLNKENLDQMVFYWFKVGKDFTASYWKQQGLIALHTLLGQKTSSALVRLSTDIIENDKEKASKTLRTFTDVITQQLFAYLP